MSKQKYFDDRERILREIWSTVNVKGKVVLDFGIGESTEILVKLRAKVIGVDNNIEKIVKYSSLGIPLIKCDILKFPFRRKIADISVFSFTLHEINPKHHIVVVKMAKDVSSEIVIIEASPKGCKAYNEYAKLWKSAMRSVGLFEEYKPLKYWVKLVEKAGFETLRTKIVKWKARIPSRVLNEIFIRDSEEWRKLGVGEEYIRRLFQLLKYAKEKGMKWSNIYVIVGKC